MLKYFFKRLFRGLLSLVVAVIIIMLLLFVVLNKTLIFAEDEQCVKLSHNQKTNYMYTMWEKYGYLDYVTYNDYLNDLVAEGEIDEDFKATIAAIGNTAAKDSEDITKYVNRFTEYYTAKGYEVIRLDAVMVSGERISSRIASGGNPLLFASLNTPVLIRVGKFFTSLLSFDNIHYVEEDIGERGLTFTLYDPVYGGEKFSPAIIGNGTFHKYMLYFTDSFPYIHTNFVKLKLGTSFSVNKGVDAFVTMTQSQGTYVTGTTYYPSGLVAQSADDLHSATYLAGSKDLSLVYADKFVDDYTNISLIKDSKSKMYYSFIISIIGSFISYMVGLPLGILLAKKKDTWVDSLGNAYIIFRMAVPGLAYLFMVKAVAGKIGLPITFSLDSQSIAIYVTPIFLSAGFYGIMRWMRRYMVDQMNSDYVKFARSGGLSEGVIFSRYIFKNAAVRIVHGMPNTIIMALTGSLFIERLFSVPGVGGLTLQAIKAYDNSVIIGVTVFYGSMSIVASIVGDILLSVMDPRISFSAKAR